MPSPIITLAAAKTIRETRVPSIRGKLRRGITDTQLAVLADLPPARVKVLESMNAHKAEEPWLDEAWAIARVLGVGSIEALIGGTTDLDKLDLGFDAHDELEVWQTGVRLPLRFGIRLGLRFGIEPLQLVNIPPMIWQLGITTASGERTGGACPWCVQPVVGGAGHLPTCTMGQLYHPRDLPVSVLGVPPRPRKPGIKDHGSKRAPGLRRLRDRLGVTQEVFARSIGKSPAYYARLEQLNDPLNTRLAEVICATYKVTPLDLYA